MKNKKYIFSLLAVWFFAGLVLCPAGSCESPKKAYQNYIKALNDGNWKKMKKYLLSEKIAEMEKGKDIEAMLQLMKVKGVMEPSVDGEWAEANEAILMVSGKGLFGEMKGTVRMVKEKKRWKVYKEEWKKKAPVFTPPPEAVEAPVEEPGETEEAPAGETTEAAPAPEEEAGEAVGEAVEGEGGQEAADVQATEEAAPPAEEPPAALEEDTSESK